MLGSGALASVGIGGRLRASTLVGSRESGFQMIGTNAPIAQAAIAMNAEFPIDNQGTRIGGQMMGDAYAANGFLYPANLQAPER